jgi:hypothetical protein
MGNRAFELSSPGSFPLSADPAFQNEVRRELDNLVACVCAVPAARCFTGLLLTGSFARGEGTVVAGHAGASRWLSDVECLVVFTARIVPRREIRRALMQIAAGLNGEAANRARGIKVELKAITAEGMTRLRPTIFTRELYEHSKLLWGDPAAVPMPPVWPDGAAVTRHDAFRLLNNRIIEQIAVRDEISRGRYDEVAARYSLAKFWIDLATSLSVFFGCYQPGYRSRQRPFEDALQKRPEILGAASSEQLLRHFRCAMDLKLGQSPLIACDPSSEFATAAGIARAVWNWESGQMLRKARGSSDWRSIFKRLNGLQTAAQRVRDWGRLFRRPARLRKLGARTVVGAAQAGSLATLIYGTGCVLDFLWDDVASESGCGREIAQTLCPIFSVGGGTALERRSLLTRATLGAWETHLRFAAA